jgi:hypothetical protein
MQYPGGKNGSGVYQKIISLMPPHEVYVEGFLGSGAILRYKRPAKASIAIDADAAVIDMWKSMDHGIPNLGLRHGNVCQFLINQVGRDLPATLIYLDPPYLFSTRSNRKYYKHEFGTEEEHIKMLHLVRRLNCMVIISGYPSDLYNRELAGWRKVSYTAQTHGGPVEEIAWMNYPEPTQLHDYRYLGENFRERERIKRKKLRWSERLKTMPQLERLAILAAIQDLHADLSDTTR